MAKAACSDAQFIALFKELQSPTLVAKVLGLSPKVVQQKRLRMERAKGIQLPVFDRRSQRQTKVMIEPSRAIIKYQIEDGLIMIGSDVHIWPGPMTTMMRAFIYYAGKLKPDSIIMNGDVFDGARVSRFGHSSWTDLAKKPLVKYELEAAQDFLGELERISPASKRFWPAGNHDMRFESRLVNNAPEFEGVPGTRLKDHFPQWLPCWRVDINNDVVVRHRELGGEHADFRNVQTQGKTIVTGHDHRASVTPYTNYTGTHWGVRCGFMAEGSDDPQFVDYLEAKAPQWQPAFVILKFREGKLLWPQLVTKHEDGSVEYCGDIIAV